ncbi:MAG TPA: hypothetical protein VF720_01945 [Candidatus Eisenbacteria bacterium]
MDRTFSKLAATLAPALLVGSLAGASFAADPASPDSAAGKPDTLQVQAAPPPSRSARQPSRIYYGGSAVVGFGNPDHVGFFPSLGYKLSPRVSIGGEIGYEYLKYDGVKNGFNNYGGSLFSRVKLTPRLFGHAEYQAISTELATSPLSDNERVVVPYLLVGGGMIQPISANASAYAEVLFDVLQDENSPYDSGEPFISFGVGVGF